MTIGEWLTPDFFALLVVLTGLMVQLGLVALLSNFLIDFPVPRRVQTALFGWGTFAFALYGLMAIGVAIGILKPHPTLYPNPYDFLLVGKPRVLGALLGGLAAGVLVGRRWGTRETLWKILGGCAIAADMGIAAAVLLWLMHQP